MSLGTRQRRANQDGAPDPLPERPCVVAIDGSVEEAAGRQPVIGGKRLRLDVRSPDDQPAPLGVGRQPFVSSSGSASVSGCGHRRARRAVALQTVEHLREQRGLGLLAALRRHLAVFVLVLRVADDAAGLLDVVVDHRDDGVIGNTALARTVVVQHVAGPEPALLHALPRNNDTTQITVQEGNLARSRAGRPCATER